VGDDNGDGADDDRGLPSEARADEFALSVVRALQKDKAAEAAKAVAKAVEGARDEAGVDGDEDKGQQAELAKFVRSIHDDVISGLPAARPPEGNPGDAAGAGRRSPMPVLSEDSDSEAVTKRIAGAKGDMPKEGEVRAFTSADFEEVGPEREPARGDGSAVERHFRGPARRAFENLCVGGTGPKDHQLPFLELFVQLCDDIGAFKAGLLRQRPDPKYVFLHGVPGSGKSFTTSVLNVIASAAGVNVINTGTSGACACHVGPAARTVHGCLNLKVSNESRGANGSRGEKGSGSLLKQAQQGQPGAFCAARVSNADILIIDEVSMAAPELIAAVRTRCLAIRGGGTADASDIRADDLFGGRLSVVLAGDMYQLPPVGGAAMYKVALDQRERLSADTLGANIFAHFRMMPLLAQVRVNDPTLAALVTLMRGGNAKGLNNFIRERRYDPKDPRFNGSVFSTTVPVGRIPGPHVSSSPQLVIRR